MDCLLFLHSIELFCICQTILLLLCWENTLPQLFHFLQSGEVILISSHLSPSVSPCVPVFGADYSTDSFECFPFCNLWDLRSHLSQLVSPQLPAAVPRLYFPPLPPHPSGNPPIISSKRQSWNILIFPSSKWLSSQYLTPAPHLLKQFECGGSGWN